MIGTMWFSNDPKQTMQAKILKAVEAHKRKYQNLPEVCLVNPNDLEAEEKKLNTTIDSVKFDGKDIEVRPFRSVLPNHFWVGIDDETPNAQANMVAQQSKNIESQSKKLLQRAEAGDD